MTCQCKVKQPGQTGPCEWPVRPGQVLCDRCQRDCKPHNVNKLRALVAYRQMPENNTESQG